MAKSIKDIFSDEYGTPEIQTPLSILVEVAEEMSRRTNWKPKAYVETSVNDEGVFIHSFMIELRSLGYTGVLFTARHDMDLYPVQLEGTAVSEDLTAFDPDELIEKLSVIVNGREVKRVIGALRANAR